MFVKVENSVHFDEDVSKLGRQTDLVTKYSQVADTPAEVRPARFSLRATTVLMESINGIDIRDQT
jgi:hypothetical protein